MKKFTSFYLMASFILAWCESEKWWWYPVVAANLIVSFLLFKKYNPEYVL